MKKCALDQKYNRCPDLREGQICGRESEDRCGMEVPEEPAQADADRREPRWYEQYYEGKSRRI